VNNEIEHADLNPFGV